MQSKKPRDPGPAFNSMLFSASELCRELTDRVAGAPTADEIDVTWKHVKTLSELVEALACILDCCHGQLSGEERNCPC